MLLKKKNKLCFSPRIYFPNGRFSQRVDLPGVLCLLQWQIRSCSSPSPASYLTTPQVGFRSIFSHQKVAGAWTDKREQALSDYIFFQSCDSRIINALSFRQHEPGDDENTLALSFFCRQGSTGNETVFNSTDNWNLRIKRLESVFSIILTSDVD